MISVLGSYKINSFRGKSPSILSLNGYCMLPSVPADVLQHITLSKKHKQGTPHINKALKYRKQMDNSNDVRAGMYDLAGLKKMSLTPQPGLPVLSHRNDDFNNFFRSFKGCRTANIDTHKTSNYWEQNLTLAVRSKR